MNDLLGNLKLFLEESGDSSRRYLLNREEVQALVKEIEDLRSREVRILSFADIRDEAKKQDERKRAERIANG
jgi:hypothetical protein